VAPENTLEAFTLALRLGATGLETDAWVTADGIAVLRHDGTVGPRLRQRPIASLRRDELPASVPSLAELYAVAGPDVPVSVDVKDPDAAPAVVGAATEAGARLDRLYLCSPDLDRLTGWRALADGPRLVHSTRLRRLRGGAERHVASLVEQGVDVLNLPYPDWTGGLTTLCHRFGVLAFGWDAHHERQLRELLGMGCDGVYSDHPDRLADALRPYGGGGLRGA
jgi:glycerophosphoryl diester phosphodiesterase